MGRSDQLAIAQIRQSAYQAERIFDVLHAVVYTRYKMGMHITGDTAEIYIVGTRSFKKTKHRLYLEVSCDPSADGQIQGRSGISLTEICIYPPDAILQIDGGLPAQVMK